MQAAEWRSRGFGGQTEIQVQPWSKRLFDLVVATALLVALAPLLALCALAVALDSPGPVLFRQQRLGQGGKPFTVLKFRTMFADADQDMHRQYATAFIQGRAAAQPSGAAQVYKLVRDPRVTRVGRWLRSTSLDELPQLWNVVRGEMSLVGPRPPIPYEIEQYEPGDLRRLAVRPGITGLWQVSGRSRMTFRQMVALDLEYIRTQSLWLDIRILLRTIPAVLSRKGAC